MIDRFSRPITMIARAARGATSLTLGSALFHSFLSIEALPVGQDRLRVDTKLLSFPRLFAAVVSGPEESRTIAFD
jgi:hypothetical protein